MKNNFQKINRLKQAKRKSLPDLHLVLNNKKCKLLPNASNVKNQKTYNIKKMKTTLKISTLEDDRESSNSKSLLFKQTDNQELLELIYTNQHAFLKQPKFNKNSKIHILSPRNSIYSIKELENFDKINNNIDISLTSNDISQKHISFNKSYDGLNISCDRKMRY